MFYFKGFWEGKKEWNLLTVLPLDYDLANWTNWNGDDPIKSSEPYDAKYAQNLTWWNGRCGVSFYCAVDKKRLQRD